MLKIVIQIWDLRTGGIFETLKYDHAVTALQFDTRKIVAAVGQNGIDVRVVVPYILLPPLLGDVDVDLTITGSDV